MCWDKSSIFLFNLTPKFFKLSLQLISRYKNWLNNLIIYYINFNNIEIFNIPEEIKQQVLN